MRLLALAVIAALGLSLGVQCTSLGDSADAHTGRIQIEVRP